MLGFPSTSIREADADEAIPHWEVRKMAQDEFAQRLRTLRKKAGLTQEELGAGIGVSVMTIRRWEWEEQFPRMDDIRRLAAVLHVSEAELLSGAKEEIRITLHYHEMEEGGDIEMDKNKFDLYMGANGSLGIRGGAKFASIEDIDGFLAKAREQLVEAFSFQQSRGAVATA